jgi:hypothetical protein
MVERTHCHSSGGAFRRDALYYAPSGFSSGWEWSCHRAGEGLLGEKERRRIGDPAARAGEVGIPTPWDRVVARSYELPAHALPLRRNGSGIQRSAG